MDLPDLQPFLNQLPGVAAATGITVVGRKAITRLVTGASDLAMIPIDNLLGTAKDKREARSVVSKAIAEAVAKSVSSDPELIERAAIAQLGEAARKQQAREKIAEAAIEELTNGTQSDLSSQQNEEQEDVDEDWLNLFSAHAERASSDQMQKLWGRILAGEIRKPKSFSLSTLRVISEMDKHTAEAFERVIAHRFGDAILTSGPSSIIWRDMLAVEEAGLIFGTDGMLGINLDPSDDGHKYYWNENFVLKMRPNQQKKSAFNFDIPVSAARMSRVGKEIASIIPTEDSTIGLRELADAVLDRMELVELYRHIEENSGELIEKFK